MAFKRSWVRSPPSPPKNRLVFTSRFFYPSRQAWYIVTRQRVYHCRLCGVYHHTVRCVYCNCRLDDIPPTADDMQFLEELMIYNGYAVDLKRNASLHASVSECFIQYNIPNNLSSVNAALLYAASNIASIFSALFSISFE